MIEFLVDLKDRAKDLPMLIRIIAGFISILGILFCLASIFMMPASFITFFAAAVGILCALGLYTVT